VSVLREGLVGGETNKVVAAAYRQYSFNQAIITNGLILTFNYTGQVWYRGLAPGFQGIPGTIYW
jgi:hypothetical protein